MVGQRRLLPSTSMLVAFEAAARTGSFTLAARELNLTQGAVSRQVGALENQLGVVFFERVRKIVQLTETGKIYAQQVAEALKIIRNASLNAMSSPLSGMLNLAILPTFGTRWLMPRFPDFLAKNPDITVNFVTKLSPFEFQDENIHAAIHYGLPNWPGTDNIFLMGEESVPVCSPTLLEGKLSGQNGVLAPELLAQLPLLLLATRSEAWQSWFQLNNMQPPNEPGMLFEQFSFVTQAAVAGLGVALLPRFLIQSELDRGELMVISDQPLQSSSGYYLVTPTDKSTHPPTVALRDWLLSAVSDR